MSDKTLASLSMLVARATALQAGGHHEAAVELSQRAIRDLETLKDGEVRLVFAAFMGMFAAYAHTAPSPLIVTIRDMIEAAVADGDPDALRFVVHAILNLIKAESEEPTQCH